MTDQSFNTLAHFAIEAEDVTRARQFYENVFDWQFEPWGPPEFYLIHGAGIRGALQKRGPNGATSGTGIQCSFSVQNLTASQKRVTDAGGKILGVPHTIPEVGELVRIADTEQNEIILIQYVA